VTFGAADERAHSPGAPSEWWETWHLDAAATDGTGCSVRLALAPHLGVAWWWTHLFVPGVAGAVVVRDHEVGFPRQGLEIRADGLWAELTCETPFEHWTYGLEAFGVRLDDPAESLRGEIGERLAVGLDLEWEVDAESGAVIGAGEAGYDQFGRVRGEILLGRARYELDAVGLRSHSWGVPHFDRATSAIWLRGDDLALSLTTDDAGVRCETHRRADGLPVAARYVIDDRIEIAAEVLGLVAIPLAGPGVSPATLARGLCRYEVTSAEPVDTSIAYGWSSWLDPD
jgi:hypothetical protein